MTAIAAYFASLGVRTDDASLKRVDAFLAKIENKLKQGVGKNGISVTPKVNVGAFEKHLRSVLRNIGGGDKQKALRVRVQVSEQHLRKSIEATTVDKPVKAKVVATLDKASIALIKEQLKTALQDLTINARLGNVSGRTRSSQGGGGGFPVGSVYSWNPNPWGGSGNMLARWAEFMAWRPGKNSGTAANRRMSDIMMKSLVGGSPETIRGVLGETLAGGIGRVGSSTMAGRGMGAIGHALGGLRGGAMGLLAGAVTTTLTKSVGLIWKGLGATLSAPFRLIGSAASAVTGAFYRIALAAAPVVLGFNAIDRKVREQSQQNVALGTMAEKYGSTGQAEKAWLMNMSNRDGVEYSSIVQPFTSFLSASAPAMGFERSKSVFEALTQYGITHGANAYSMQNALKAFGQINLLLGLLLR